MSDKQNEIIEEDDVEEMTVTIETDEGDIDCAILTIFDANNREYIALLPLDEDGNNEDGEVWIYRYSENPDDPNEEPELEYIEDDAEYEEVEKVFAKFIDSVEHDEIV